MTSSQARTVGDRRARVAKRCLLPLLVSIGLVSAMSCGGAEEPLSVLDEEFEELRRQTPIPETRWHGDLDAMIERRLIRALVSPNRTSYFFDGAHQRGMAYEGLRALENQINEDLGRGHLKVHIVIVPTTRDRLIQDLIDGRGDIAASNLTVTAARQQQIEFTAPFVRGVNEIVVTGPDAPSLSSLDDLSGTQVFIRRSSSYWRSLERLNEALARNRKPKVELIAADEVLETEDILEMVNAGLVPITIADEYLARYWAQIYDSLTLHPELAVRSNAEIAWAIRKNSPRLRAALDEFVKSHKQGTLMGNILIQRYWRNAKGVEDSLGQDEMARFRETTAHFQKYARMYDLNWLMLMAQAYQESGLDHRRRSSAGAIGIMQVLRSTAEDPNVGIADIDDLEPNIHAGAKYMRFLIDRYFEQDGVDPLNRSLFALAAYNAGPGRIARLRQKAAATGLDPNLWFRNVEVVAARDIGRETVQYVSNIYKYYLSYQLVTEHQLRKRTVRGG